MMCMTELHGGVCHRTSTPHKSGNKMKEKKKKKKKKNVIWEKRPTPRIERHFRGSKPLQIFSKLRPIIAIYIYIYIYIYI